MKQNTTTPGWIARTLCISAILFVSMFALDAFEGDATFLEKLAAFGMHMIPSLVLLLVLAIAWTHELAGGILFLIAALGTAPLIYNLNYERTQSVAVGVEVLSLINLPFVIIGVLFLLSYFRERKKQAAY